MHIPQLPTDSLYKFLALFSLVAIFASFYFANAESNKLVSEIHEHNFQAQLLKLDFNHLNQQAKHWKNKMQRLCDTNPQCYCKFNDKDRGFAIEYAIQCDEQILQALASQQDEYDKLLDTASRKHNELVIRKDLIDFKTQALAGTQAQLQWIIGVCVIGSLAGFAFWYFKVQVYQDQILATQVMNSMQAKHLKQVNRSISTPRLFKQR